MMKRIVLLMMMAGLSGFAATPAHAQLGDMLKKARKTVGSVRETVGGKTTPTVKPVDIPSGGTMENPLAPHVDIELVGAYGKSTSENYGTVYLVMKVKMIMNKEKVGLGGAINNVKMMAVDQDGNSYLTNTDGQYPKPVAEGLAVKVKLDDKDARFQDVRKTATTMQMIRMGCHIDATHKGVVTFRDVPVLWDVEPE